MGKLKSILIDDEKGSLESLAIELREYCPQVEMIGMTQDPEEGLKLIGSLSPDLLFLDIEMPKLNGFELLQRLSKLPPYVIFVTAYDQFAIRAFEFNAVDYVLKPVRKAKLISAVEKAVQRQMSKMDQGLLEALMQNIRLQVHTGLENIALPTQEGFTMIHINDIHFLQADSNYTWVHHNNGRKYLVTKTLKELEDMLAFPQYFRVHKSYLVNLNHVDHYVRGQGGYLVMKDKTQIPVARTQKPELMKTLGV